MERYPENVEVMIDDFRNSGWKAALDTKSSESFSAMWRAFSSSASQAIEEGKENEGKVLWLLADACSMILKPENFNEPFTPFTVLDDRRSALPEDFQTNEVALFSQIVEEVNDAKLKSRIADLTWLLLEPRDPKYALIAIDSYLQIPISIDSWQQDGRECWERAIRLCLMLKSSFGDRLQEVSASLLKSIEKANIYDKYLALWIADLLSKYKLDRDYRLVIAGKLENLAHAFDDSGDLRRARDYFDSASEYYKYDDQDKYAEMIVKVAEGWVKEAISRQTFDSSSNMVAARFYENAIQTYRKIPKNIRPLHNIDDRIAEIYASLGEASKNSLTEMCVITSDPIDISDLIEDAKKAVRGKSSIDALAALANIYPGPKVKKIRDCSIEIIRDYPFRSLSSVTYMSKDGRVIARRPGVGFERSPIDEDVIWPEMVRNYLLELAIGVQGDIWPALEVIRLEHRLKEIDFYLISRDSPIVPHGRERLFAKALYAGYDNDFVSAIHILIPQIEHLVRFHLKKREVKTTNLDRNGIENENGLSTLMELPEISRIFGEDLAFELKALFCSPYGPDLRNKLAHGLVEYEECESIYSIYAWWIALRIVFNTFWKAKKADISDKQSDGVQGSEND